MWNSAIKVKNQWRKQKPYYSIFQQSCYLMWWNDNRAMGKPIHQDGGGFRNGPPAWSWIPETCSPCASPAFRVQGQTSLTIADVGSLFPGAQPPKAHGKYPCKLEPQSLLLLHSPTPWTLQWGPGLLFALQHASSTASFIMCLRTGLVLICMWTDNGLQWVPCHSWDFYFAWVVLCL